MWHLWHNLCEAVDKTVAAHRGELQPDLPEHTEQAPPDMVMPDKVMPDKVMPDQPASPADPADPAVAVGTLVVRTRERYAAVQALRQRGRSITAIGRELGLDRRTARRFVRAEHVEDLLAKVRSRESLLDAFKPYLHERFNAGHTDTASLTLEITAVGYRGSDKTVRRYLQPFRAGLTAPAPVPVAPSVRQVAGWLTRHPDSLGEDDACTVRRSSPAARRLPSPLST